METKKLTDNISVCGQISEEDLADIVASGYKTIINNRPDGEVFNQPTGAAIEQKAKELGIAYHFVPVTSQGLSIDDIVAYQTLYQQCEKPVFAYCRSGTRSTTLWALMQASLKDDIYSPEVIKGIAHNAGYDLSHVMNGIEYLHQAPDALSEDE